MVRRCGAVRRAAAVAVTALAGAAGLAPAASAGDGAAERIVRLATAFVQSTKVDKVWGSQLGTGKGIGVAVIDTGIAGDLPDFRSPGSSQSRVKVSDEAAWLKGLVVVTAAGNRDHGRRRRRPGHEEPLRRQARPRGPAGAPRRTASPSPT